MVGLLPLAFVIAPAALPDPTPEEDPHTSAPLNGSLSGELGLDLLRAHSRETGGASLVGVPESIALQEAGLRVRLSGRELDERLSLEIDYHGREPLGGDVQNSTLRLLYRGELGYALIPDRLSFGAGRFVAPSVLLLIVDGIKADFSTGGATISPFAGRRAITTSRRNVPLERFPPAAGLGVSWRAQGFSLEGAVAYARDEAVLVKGLDEQVTSYDSGSGFLRVVFQPADHVFAGGEVAFAERATYVLGPTWREIELTAQAIDLWNGVLYVDWRPLRSLRFGYDFHTQRTAVFRKGLEIESEPELAAVPDEPRFADHRITAAHRVLDRAWARGDLRLRLRPDRHERRYGGSLEVDELGIEGLIFRGSAAYEDVVFDDESAPRPDLDRLLWSASLGYRIAALEAEAGASFIDRRSGPLSGRRFDRASPGDPGSPVDLAPFVLDAQRFAFVRAFYADEHFFGGIDVEQSLEDGGELRLLFQAGLLVEASW